MNDNQLENAKAQMRKGTLEYCILLIISKDEVYASDILKELKQANLLVVEGTLYPLLSRLKSSELLSYNWVESPSGPPRKYYSLTEKGRENLKQLNENWQVLTESVKSLIKNHEKNN
ncbi:MAG: transcriptional regulator PadR family protein [Candidatus Doudnabacteria bacterium]|nr:transcriptional regulator PadR family protein [Candidatus Doudnabacteria bacterium]